jgi:hypothetical protein
MKTIVGISILLATIAFSSTVNAQVLETNAPASQPVATNNPSTGASQLIPEMIMADVPITAAIEHLARQCDINYIVDPHLFQISKSNPEPEITFRLVNVTARDTLNRMLNLRNLVMIQDPVTTVARITRINHTTNVVDASLLDMSSNNSAFSPNSILPIIEFKEVPLDIALVNLIRQSAVDIKIDPRITADYATLSIRWENITAKQAILALCNNYDFEIVKDATTGDIQIKPKPKAEK